MNWFSSAARMGTVLPLALLFFVSVPVVTSPCYGQTGTLPNNAQGINDNYDALEKLIDQAEASLKDAIANGDTQKANAMRRNLRFYAKRLARLENVATGIAKRTKDSQMVEKLSKLQGRVTRILDSNKVALRSGTSSGGAFNCAGAVAGADGAKRDPDPQVVAALVKDCQWLSGGTGH
jgi:hypothetical protein